MCRKLALTPEDHLVEIGTGWGGLAIHAATHYGCRVTTTTISREQHDYAKEKIARLGLNDRITLLFQDYRDLTGQFDKLVSIEMVEAVGANFLETYVAKCSSLLKPEGSMLLQAITIQDQHYEQALGSVDYIQRFIFPGSFIPSVTAHRAGGVQGHGHEDRRISRTSARTTRRTLRAVARAVLREPAGRAQARPLRQLRAPLGVLPLLLRRWLHGARARRRAHAAREAWGSTRCH